MKFLASILFAFALWSSSAFAASQQFWFVGSNQAIVWSLEANNFIPVEDSSYVTWFAEPGNLASQINSTSDLYEVLQVSYPDHLAASAPVLEQYGGLSPTQSFDWRMAHGLDIVYTGFPDLNGRYAIQDQERLIGLLLGAILRCGTVTFEGCNAPFPNSSPTQAFLDADQVAHNVSIVQLRVIALAITDYVSLLYTELVAELAGSTPNWPSSTKIVP